MIDVGPSWQDVAGMIGLALVCLGLVALLPWPAYPERDFRTSADRRRASTEALQHGREFRTRNTPTAR